MADRYRLALAIGLAGLFAQHPLVAQQKTSAEKRIALISELTGTATIQSPASAAAPVGRFASLSDGTILRVGRQSRVLLVLASGKRFVLAAGARATVRAGGLAGVSGSIEELPALPALPPLVALEAKAPTALGGVRLRSNAMTGLSPANGTVLVSRAVLQFAAVQGAATYRVEIEDEAGRIVFGVETGGTEVPVPPDLLTAGARYYWTVRTIDRPGAQARGGAEFATLTSEAMDAREALKRRLSADADVHSLALLATIDMHLGLHQEALAGFRAALALAPDDKTLKEAIQRLQPIPGPGGLQH